MDYTILHNSGGFHGHQLKDYFGGVAAAKIMGLRYTYTPYNYLDFFGINEGEPRSSVLKRSLPFLHQRISGPFWDGFETYTDFKKYMDKELEKKQSDRLIIFEKAFRVHPHQARQWFAAGLIERDVFHEIVQETSAKYRQKHQLLAKKKEGDVIEVAMHISRGVDFNRVAFPEHFENPYNVRYMFGMDYFVRIYQQVKSAIQDRKIHFSIYTEERNSEDIVTAFKDKEDVTLNVGCNRGKPDKGLIENIFRAFVEADLLVSCNSSFSTMAVFFRGDKPTIYHPHLHMDDLPEWPYLKTDVEGFFSAERLIDKL